MHIVRSEKFKMYNLQFGGGWDAHGGFNHTIIAGISQFCLW